MPQVTQGVAVRLAELAPGRPACRVTDLAGPADFDLRDLVRGYLIAEGKRRLTVPMPLPGKAGKAYRGGLTLSLDGDRGARTWEEFLAAR
ncbi:hypothetical protein ACFWN2_15250 [Lentzea sp. NPDC058436]|uniref:hypothetical protein n=1 Tax=Lentzea sp. NPDC058436 TaxID=3346499 RepID=UPI00364D7FDB